MKLLILTDHSNHSSENSLYALAREISSRRQYFSVVDVASRGNPANAPFFYGNSVSEPLHLCRVDASFDFNALGTPFLQNTHLMHLSDYDWIFLRLPRPISDAFFSFLVAHFPQDRIINRPSGIEVTSTKAFLLQIPDVCPPIQLCSCLEDIEQFRQRFPIVLKPLKEYGGKGILKVDGELVWDGNNPVPIRFEVFAERYAQNPTEYLGMKFLKNVSLGDKRIIVANGNIITSSMRVPAAGAWMCNVAQGGSSYYSPPDENEQRIVARISPLLLHHGIFLYGLDTLADDDGTRLVSEINTLSIGGIAPSERNSGKPAVKLVIDELWRYMATIDN